MGGVGGIVLPVARGGATPHPAVQTSLLAACFCGNNQRLRWREQQAAAPTGQGEDLLLQHSARGKRVFNYVCWQIVQNLSTEVMSSSRPNEGVQCLRRSAAGQLLWVIWVQELGLDATSRSRPHNHMQQCRRHTCPGSEEPSMCVMCLKGEFTQILCFKGLTTTNSIKAEVIPSVCSVSFLFLLFLL